MRADIQPPRLSCWIHAGRYSTPEIILLDPPSLLTQSRPCGPIFNPRDYLAGSTQSTHSVTAMRADIQHPEIILLDPPSPLTQSRPCGPIFNPPRLSCWIHPVYSLSHGHAGPYSTPEIILLDLPSLLTQSRPCGPIFNPRDYLAGSTQSTHSVTAMRADIQPSEIILLDPPSLLTQSRPCGPIFNPRDYLAGFTQSAHSVTAMRADIQPPRLSCWIHPVYSLSHGHAGRYSTPEIILLDPPSLLTQSRPCGPIFNPRDYLAGFTQSTHSVTAMRADIQPPRLSCWIHPVYSLSHGHMGRYSTPEIILLDPPSLLTQSRPCGPIFNPPRLSCWIHPVYSLSHGHAGRYSTPEIILLDPPSLLTRSRPCGPIFNHPRLSCWIHPVYSLSHGHAGRYSTPEIILLDPPSLITQSRPCGPIFNPEIILLDPPSLLTQSRPCGPIFNPRDYIAGSTQSTHSVTAMRADIQPPRLSCWIHPVYSLSHGHAGRYSTPEIILLDPPSLLTQSRPCGPILNRRDYLAGSTQSTHSVTAMRADIQPPRLSCWIHPVYSLSHGHAGRYSTPEIILLDPPSLLTQSRPCGPIFNPRDYLAGSTQSTQYLLSHGHAGRYSTPEIILLDLPSLLTQSRPCGPIFNPRDYLAGSTQSTQYSLSHGHAGRYSTPEIILLDPPSLLTQSRPCGPIFNPRDYLAGSTQSTHSVTAMRADIQPPEIILLDPPSLLTQSRPCGPIFNPQDYLAGSMRADIQPLRLSCRIHPVYSLSHGHAGRYSTPEIILLDPCGPIFNPRDYLAGSTQSTHSVTAMRADIQPPRLSCWIHPVYSLSHGHAGRYSTPEIILLDPPSLLTQSRPCGSIFNPRDYLAGSTQSTHSVTAMRADIQPLRLSCWIHAGRYSTP